MASEVLYEERDGIAIIAINRPEKKNTLTDAVGATSLEEHANAIKFDYPMFSKPITSEEFVAALAGAAATADTSRGY